MNELDTSKRNFLKTAAYVAPVILTLNARVSFAGTGSPDCVGNPGNDKCVGQAGETPNCEPDDLECIAEWGGGTQGQSDGD